jgi:hypothetical protein
MDEKVTVTRIEYKGLNPKHLWWIIPLVLLIGLYIGAKITGLMFDGFNNLMITSAEKCLTELMKCRNVTG